MKITYERLVKIKAIDWGFWDDPSGYESSGKTFKPHVGWIHGQVVEETDEYIAVCLESFDTHRVRKIISVPKVCILEPIVEFGRIGIGSEQKKKKPEEPKKC